MHANRVGSRLYSSAWAVKAHFPFSGRTLAVQERD